MADQIPVLDATILLTFPRVGSSMNWAEVKWRATASKRPVSRRDLWIDSSES